MAGKNKNTEPKKNNNSGFMRFLKAVFVSHWELKLISLAAGFALWFTVSLIL